MHIRLIPAFLLLTISSLTFAAGNHPDAGSCPTEKPHFAICTHSFHSLEGWYSNNCRATQEEAEKDAEAHAKKYHKGNSRWTGVSKQRFSGYD